MEYTTDDVSIVIPNWNGRKLLEKNLPSVMKAAEGAEVIVVDDGSTDDSVTFLEQHFPAVGRITKSENEGFASTVNLGVSHAKGDIVILLNTDIEPDKHFLEHLLAHFSNENVFAVGCLDKSEERGMTILRGRGEAAWQRGFFIHRRGEVDKTDTAWVSGGSGAFRKSVWEKLGGMDTRFNPFYWEDIDLSYRARKAGYTLVFEPKSVVIHRHEEGSILTSEKREHVKSTAYRNQLLFIWKNITDIQYLIEHCFFLHVQLIKSLVKLDMEFIKGYFFALPFLPSLIMTRLTNTVALKSDSQILRRKFE